MPLARLARLALFALPAVVVAGCAIETTATSASAPDAARTPDAASSVDAPPSVDGSPPDDAPPTIPDAPAPTPDAPVVAVDAPPVCADLSLPPLAAPSDSTFSGAELVLRAGTNQRRDGCSTWYGGRDAAARFVAPVAGRWTFVARGDQLWNFAARRPCADASGQLACAQLTDFHAPSPFSRPLSVTVRLEAGEPIALIADGCPDVGGVSCAWTLYARQEPAAGCFDPDRRCGDGERCVTPPGADVAASRCEPGHAPVVLSARALRAARTLGLTATFRDEDGDPVSTQVRLLDADGAPLGGRSAFTLYTPSPDRSGVYAPWLVEAPTMLAAARFAEFLVEDAVHLRSEARRVAVEEAPVAPDGAPCDERHVLDTCAEGSTCNARAVCERQIAPTLLRATAYRGAMPDRAALVVAWTDPNHDVDTVEYTLLGAEPVTFTTGISVAPDGASSVVRWGGDPFRGAARVRVRVRDRSFQWSEAREAEVLPVATVSAGAACDPDGVASVCATGTICTRYGDPACRETTCRPDERACPAGVTPLGFTATGTEPIVATASGRTPGTPTPLATSPCDAPLAGSTLHRFVAPADGSYNFSVVNGRGERGLTITLRRHCAIGDGPSLLGAQQAPDDYQVSLSTPLRAGEEVYLLVSTPGVAREYGVSVHLRH